MEELVFVDRRDSNNIKWNNFNGKYKKSGLIAMWVADMDFKSPKCVQNALRDYVDYGIYGYSTPQESYYQAFIDWERKNHGVDVKREWIKFAPGVVPALNWIINIYTNENDSILINPPVYYPFFNAIKDNNRSIVESKLVEKDLYYYLDFEDIEKKIVENNVKAYILCSPHNPISRVWTKDEIDKIVDICKKHNVLLISDEIHQDLTYSDVVNGAKKNYSLINYADKMDNLIVATAATKTFNLAAVGNSFVIIPNENLSEKFKEYSLKNRLNSGTSFGFIAVEAAYREGHDWMLALKKRLYENYKILKDELDGYKGIRLTKLEGTYLVWIDFREALNGKDIYDFMENKCSISVDYGEWFGGEDYKGFVRLNLATSEDLIKKVCSIIKTQL